MKKFAHPDTVTRILTAVLAAAFGAVAFVALATPVAQHFNHELLPAAQWLIAALGAGVAFLGLRGLVDFTNDCMSVPTSGMSLSPVSPRQGSVPSLAEESGNQTVELGKVSQPDGSIRVKITSNGLSKREFNTLRARLGNTKMFPTVKWDRPVNLKDRKRIIEGTVAAGSAQETTVHRLEEMTGRRV